MNWRFHIGSSYDGSLRLTEEKNAPGRSLEMMRNHCRIDMKIKQITHGMLQQDKSPINCIYFDRVVVGMSENIHKMFINGLLMCKVCSDADLKRNCVCKDTISHNNLNYHNYNDFYATACDLFVLYLSSFLLIINEL